MPIASMRRMRRDVLKNMFEVFGRGLEVLLCPVYL